RPSPMPAPMAPPARASPPPTNAPAVLTADSMVSAATVSPWIRAGWPAQWGLPLVRSSRCSGRELGLGCAVGGVGGHVVGGRLVVVVLLGVARPRRPAEVEDRQEREDEGLDGADGHVEELPDDGEENR